MAIMFAGRVVVEGAADLLERLTFGEVPARVFGLREEPATALRRAFRFDFEREPVGEWLAELSARHPGLQILYEYVDEYGGSARRAVWRGGELVVQESIAPASLTWVEWAELDD